MFRNYFKTAIRNIWRYKYLSAINIGGLSLGLACVMLIMLFVNDEFSFDRNHVKGDRIVRLVQTFTDTSGQESRTGISSTAAGPAYMSSIPELAQYCRVKGWRRTVKKGAEGIEEQVMMTDPSFFELFTVDLQSGNRATMLQHRHSIVITEEMALKYFGQQDAMGKILELDMDGTFEPFEVTGIVRNAPLNSSIQYSMIIPFENDLSIDPAERAQQLGNWGMKHLNTFFLLHRAEDRAKAESKLLAAYQQHNKAAYEEAMKRAGATARLELFLQPLREIHLDNRFFASNGLRFWSDSKYSYILSGLAILLLVIACINFINISLARSIRRNKEIGIRKVSGGSRTQVMIQFLAESFIVTGLAFLPAILLVYLFLPTFSTLASKHFDITYLFQPSILALFTGLWVLVSLLSGGWPAFVASGFTPSTTLYGRFKLVNKNRLGKSLVVMQFAIALGLIISMVFFNKQFTYMTRNNQLGYRTENVIRLSTPWGKPEEGRLLRQTLAQNPAIVQVGSKGGDFNKSKYYIGTKPTDWIYTENIDDQYLQTLDIGLAKGRYLSYNNTIDTISTCLVNEAFANELLDRSKDPIGQIVKLGNQRDELQIVGVVKNYHIASFKEKISPAIYTLTKSNGGNVFIQYASGKAQQATAALEKAYATLLPYFTLDYTFMEDWNRNRYGQEEQWKKIVTYAASIAILISCLGLFALATLSVEQRVKEIGIRKVLGASAIQVAGMLSVDFLKLVLIAFLIAAPIAGWLMYDWLQDFAYRIPFSGWIIAGTGLAVLAIALLVVSLRTIGAALANPVKNLRSE
ncbi:ABC transporter permease [Paraflavitalea pollutisoli]|uniref:ABC transporter permease n=1 Tax=Paraflavitalea pollutisoli TaxID=3034143 RepID=UPI0023EAF13F|nr:ABC transporter permease [Paraflavitalea sp. H1-2-19X]